MHSSVVAKISPLIPASLQISNPLNPAQPVLPVETLEAILDCLGTECTYYVAPRDFRRNIRTLKSCCLTCRALLPRSLFNLVQIVEIRSRDQLFGFSNLLTSRPYLGFSTQSVILRGQLMGESHGRLMGESHVLVFPLILAGKLKGAGTLHILDMEDIGLAGTHPSFFRALSEFDTLTSLVLDGVHLASPSYFFRLLGAMPRLTSLACAAISFRTGNFVPSVAQRYVSHIVLERLKFDFAREYHMNELLNTLIDTGICQNLMQLVAGAENATEMSARPGLKRLLSPTSTSLGEITIGFATIDSFRRALGHYFNIVQPHLRKLHIIIHEASPHERPDWVTMMLAQIASTEIEEIDFDLFPVYDLDTTLVDILHNVLHHFNPDECSLTDEVLAHPKFSALKNGVRFHVYVRPSPDLEGSVTLKFCLELESRFPRLLSQPYMS